MMTPPIGVSQARHVGPSDWWVILRVGVLLCLLPLLLRRYSLPQLLQRLTSLERVSSPPVGLELDHVVRLVRRICEVRLFRTRLFPRACLRQALALYATISYCGEPVTIHFGILRDRKALRGHSWVTVNGQPMAERGDPAVFHIVYSHSSSQSDNQSNAVSDGNEIFSPKGLCV